MSSFVYAGEEDERTVLLARIAGHAARIDDERSLPEVMGAAVGVERLSPLYCSIDDLRRAEANLAARVRAKDDEAIDF